MTKPKVTVSTPKAKVSLATAARHVLAHLSPADLARVIKDFAPKAQVAPKASAPKAAAPKAKPLAKKASTAKVAPKSKAKTKTKAKAKKKTVAKKATTGRKKMTRTTPAVAPEAQAA